ncbi:tbc1 domain family member [Anaeramoeba flamelloides]|uniref:Tbc1 domain family member n=1 Tax=Anaeramoeba flamelloides TaxID=1746091 RepID=A0AAV7YQR9_9EUKA|nr:tbc1 domain family member [Anaeramoeba flamelloides]
MEEYKTTFSKDFNFHRLRKEIKSGKFMNTKIRSIIWRVCLGCFSEDPNPEKFCSLTREHRKRYSILKSSYLIPLQELTTKKEFKKNQNVTVLRFLPKQKENKGLSKTIQLDIERTNPELSFYSKPLIKQQMFNILFIYSKEHPDLSYRQGMHELLAPIIYVVHQEYQKNAQNKKSVDHPTFSVLTNQKYIEEDCYLMFERLMTLSQSLYFSNNNNKTVFSKSTTKTNLDSNKNGNGTLQKQIFRKVRRFTKNKQKKKKKQENGGQNKQNSPKDNVSQILILCKRVQNYHLKKYDEELFRYFSFLQLEPQLYSLRWYRLLLSREFELHEVLLLWDQIFSDYTPLVYIGYIIVAMLMMIRDKLFDPDETLVLQQLFNYKLDDNIVNLLKFSNALRCPNRDNIDLILNLKKEKKNPNLSINIYTHFNKLYKPNDQKNLIQYYSNFFKAKPKSNNNNNNNNNNNINNIGGSSSNNINSIYNNKMKLSNLINATKVINRHRQLKKSIKELNLKQFEINRLKNKIIKKQKNQYNMGLYLNIAIEGVSGHLFPKLEDSNNTELEEKQKKFYPSILELKKVKDVLCKQLLFSDLQNNKIKYGNEDGNGNVDEDGGGDGNRNGGGGDDILEKIYNNPNKSIHLKNNSDQTVNENEKIKGRVIINNISANNEYFQEIKLTNIKNNRNNIFNEKNENIIFESNDEIIDIFSQSRLKSNNCQYNFDENSSFVISKFENYLRNSKELQKKTKKKKSKVK